jgi:hypothetical protein
MAEFNYGTVSKWFYSQLPKPHMLPRSVIFPEEDDMQIWIDLSDHRDLRPALTGSVPGWAVADIRVLQGVPLGALPIGVTSTYAKPIYLPCLTSLSLSCSTASASSGTCTGLPTTAPGGPRLSACAIRASVTVSGA